MDMNTGPGMIQPSPTKSTVLASLKRNVLWGALGLVALIFTTVCIMYYSSQQTLAAVEPVVAAPTAASIAPAESATQPIPQPQTPAPQTATLPAADEIIPAQPTVSAPVERSTPPTTTPVAAPVVTKPVAVTPVSRPVTAPVSAQLKKLDPANVPHGTKIYVIQSGDTLEKIARDVYGDSHKWKRLADLNKEYVSDFRRLKVGQQILIERTINPRDYADY